MVALPEWINAIPEQVGASSFGTGGFSHGGANFNRSYLVGQKNLSNFIYYTLGYNSPRNDGKSGVYRQTPVADPQFPFMYASSVANLQGNRYIQSTDWEYNALGAGNTLIGQPMPVYADWSEYTVTLNFDQRPYKVLDDTFVEQRAETISFSEQNNQVYVFPNVWPEWLRYTTYSFETRSEFLTVDTGSCYYYAKNNPQINIPNQGVSAGSSMTKALFKTGTFKITWRMVPYQFVTGLNLDTGVVKLTALSVGQGRVNQSKFFGFKAGTLLFEGYTIDNVYSQGTYGIDDLVPDSLDPTRWYFRDNLLADVTLNFSYREDTQTEDYPDAPTNKNTILYGNNLFLRGSSPKAIAIIKDTEFDLATHKIKDNKLGVLYPSFPMQLLFTDPSYFSAIYAG